MWLGASNQLIQIDTGVVQTYFWNPTSGAQLPIWAGIGEIQVLGQRYVGQNSITAANPFGSPAIYQLVKVLATSAVTLAAFTAAGAPAPVYWTDITYTTVTPIMSEGLNGNAQSVAGYLMPNTTALPNLTLAQILGAQCLIQVAGYLPGAWGPTTTPGINNNIVGSAGSFTSTASAAAPATTKLGIQLSAAAAGLVNVLVTSDNF